MHTLQRHEEQLRRTRGSMRLTRPCCCQSPCDWWHSAQQNGKSCTASQQKVFNIEEMAAPMVTLTYSKHQEGSPQIPASHLPWLAAVFQLPGKVLLKTCLGQDIFLCCLSFTFPRSAGCSSRHVCLWLNC